MVKNDRQCYHGVDLKQNDQLVYFLLNQKIWAEYQKKNYRLICVLLHKVLVMHELKCSRTLVKCVWLKKLKKYEGAAFFELSFDWIKKNSST